MQVLNLLYAARWKHRMQKSRQKSPSRHHRTNLSGYIFATKAHIDNRKKVVKQRYLLHMFLQYGELRLTSGWDRFVSLGHPCKFQRVSSLGNVTARHSTLRSWTEGGHHVGHWPTFLVAKCSGVSHFSDNCTASTVLWWGCRPIACTRPWQGCLERIDAEALTLTFYDI